MKECNFSGFVSAKAVGFSEGHFDLVVQALDDAPGNGLLGTEIVQQNIAVLSQTGGDLLERDQAGASDRLAPGVQKLSGPGRRDITPKVLEGRDQPVSSDRSQTRMFQLPHAPVFAGSPVLSVFEQSPAEFFQARLESGLSQRSRFVFAHLIDGFIELLANVEAIQNVQRVEPSLDRGQIRRPHVRTDIADAGAHPISQGVEALEQGLLRAVIADPQQPDQVLIDLINQSPEHSAHAHADFVDPDSLDVLQDSIFEPVLDHPLDRGVNVGPGHPEAQGNFLPGKLAAPTSQEQSEAIAHTMLARSPRNLLHDHAAGGAIDSAHRVNQCHRKFPQGWHDPSARLQMIIRGARSAAAAALSFGTQPRHDQHFNRVRYRWRKPHRFVKETLDRLHLVEYGFECNGIHEGLAYRSPDGLASPSVSNLSMARPAYKKNTHRFLAGSNFALPTSTSPA